MSAQVFPHYGPPYTAAENGPCCLDAPAQSPMTLTAVDGPFTETNPYPPVQQFEEARCCRCSARRPVLTTISSASMVWPLKFAVTGPPATARTKAASLTEGES